jgi:hypothetical protein
MTKTRCDLCTAPDAAPHPDAVVVFLLCPSCRPKVDALLAYHADILRTSGEGTRSSA